MHLIAAPAPSHQVGAAQAEEKVGVRIAGQPVSVHAAPYTLDVSAHGVALPRPPIVGARSHRHDHAAGRPRVVDQVETDAAVEDIRAAPALHVIVPSTAEQAIVS